MHPERRANTQDKDHHAEQRANEHGCGPPDANAPPALSAGVMVTWAGWGRNLRPTAVESPKMQAPRTRFGDSKLGLVSDFGFRISDLEGRHDQRTPGSLQ